MSELDEILKIYKYKGQAADPADEEAEVMAGFVNHVLEKRVENTKQEIKDFILGEIEKAKDTDAPLTNLTKWIKEL